MEHYYDFRPKRNCENCVYCEMYHKDFTLCSLKEKWVESELATYCEQFVADGGYDEN